MIQQILYVSNESLLNRSLRTMFDVVMQIESTDGLGGWRCVTSEYHIKFDVRYRCVDGCEEGTC